VWPGGVEAEEAAAGAVIKQHLQLIVYSGTRLHYFDKRRATVDRLFDSIHVD
jgi:hypothetical protein